MKRTHFNYKFQVNKTAAEVYDKVNLVSKWWTNDMEGALEKIQDEFTVRFGESFVTMEVMEMIAGKKIAWAVKNCFWAFLQNKTDWDGTNIIWEITTRPPLTQLNLTHVGLVPGKESFEICKEGWGLYVGNSLYRFITDGEGIPFGHHCNL